MNYLHANPLKKLKVSNSMLYERARTAHVSSFSGIVSWHDTTQTSSPNPKKNKQIWENPNMRREKCN
jgi:hypothetical protein